MPKISDEKFIQKVETDLKVNLGIVLGEGSYGKVYTCTQKCSVKKAAANNKLAAKLSSSTSGFKSDR